MSVVNNPHPDHEPNHDKKNDYESHSRTNAVKLSIK